MGVRSWFLSVLYRGEEPDRDPDERVEAAVVPLPEGPMLVAVLQEEGIEALGIESIDPALEIRSRMRVFVRRADLARAHELIDRIS